MYYSKKIIIVVLSASFLFDAFPQSGSYANRKDKGYYNITQIGMLMGNRRLSEQPDNNDSRNLQVTPSFSMINGIMSNENWATGIGVGFEIFDYNLFPVFFDLRHTWRDNDASPFFAIKTGYAFGPKKQHYDNLYLHYLPPNNFNDVDLKHQGGFLFQPEIGVKIPLSENADLQVTVAYRFQKIKTKVTQSKNIQNANRVYETSLNRMSFGVAIMFR